MFFEIFFYTSYSLQKAFCSSFDKQKIHISENILSNQVFHERITNYDNLCIYNCSFYFIQSSTTKGGAIYLEINSNTNIIDNCTFKYCEGSEGGSLYVACTTPFDIKITNSTFESNLANKGGCIFSFKTNIQIKKCIFNDNLVNGITNPKNCSSYGGCIYLKECISSINECIFMNNTVSSDSSLSSVASYSLGGCVCSYESDLEFSFCDFSNNIANSTSILRHCFPYGAAIYCYNSNTTINKCNFIHNLATSQANLSNPHSEGGAINIENYNATFCDCIFDNNTVFSYTNGSTVSYAEGGSIYLYAYNTSVINCYFTNNIAHGVYEAYCGAGFFNSELIIMNNCSFISNRADGHHSKASAIELENTISVIIDNCTFINNTSTGKTIDGGVIMFYIYKRWCEFSIKSCIFNDNLAKCYREEFYHIKGGLIMVQNTRIENISISFANCTFNNNIVMFTLTADYFYCYGGIIYFELYHYITNNQSPHKITINYCNFCNNSVHAKFLGNDKSCINGSCLYIQKSDASIDSCVFVNNSLYYDSLLAENTISGVVIFFLSYDFHLSSTIFENNNAFFNNSSSAYGYGGVISVEQYPSYIGTNNCTCFIADCRFLNNCLNSNNNIEGGDLYSYMANITVQNSEFIANPKNILSSIYYIAYVNNFLNIHDCTFKINVFNNSLQKSLILLSVRNSSDLINSFLNNQIFITNSDYNNYYHIFNGTLNKIQKWAFENNCLTPYNSSLFKKDEFQLYKSDGSEVIEFNDAFTNKCIFLSNEFTFSEKFTYSFVFTESFQFSKSLEFTKSIEFTKSFQFTYSFEFTESFQFSKSLEFTKSFQFSKSLEFKKSSQFSKSLEFTKSFQFSESLEFTKSIEFTKSFQFTYSFEFSKPNEFIKSSQFTYSYIFSKSNEFTKSLSLFGFVTLSFEQTINIINSFSMSNIVSESFNINGNNKNKSKGQLIGIIVGCIAAVLIISIISIVVFIKIKKSRNQISDKKRNISSEEQTAKIDDKITFPQTNIDEDEEDLDFWL